MVWRFQSVVFLVGLLLVLPANLVAQRVPLIRSPGGANAGATPTMLSPFDRLVIAEAPRLQALRDPLYRKELELGEMEGEIQQLINRHFSTMKDVQNSVDWPRLDEAERREVLAKLTDLCLVADEEVGELLGPAKSKRAAQLIHWQWMRQRGPLSLLCDSSLASDLAVSKEQKEALRRLGNQIATELVNECFEIEKAAIRRMGESLSANQSRLLEGWLLWDDEDFQTEMIDPDALVGSLRDSNMDALSRRLSQTERGELLASDGKSDDEALSADWRDEHLPIFDLNHRYDGDRVALLHRLRNGALNLSPSQIELFESAIGEQQQKLEVLRVRYGEWERRDDPERIEFVGRVRELLDQTEARVRFDVLGPDQRRKLDRLHWRLLSRSRGPLAMIVDGSLGKELDIKGKQIESLLDDREEILRIVEDQIREVHEDVLERVISVLEPAQRRMVKEALGEPPSSTMRGSITKLQASLATEDAANAR